jgi:hypothetical protein
MLLIYILRIITRQYSHSLCSSFRVFSLTESYTSNKAFNSHFTFSRADLLYSSVLLVPIRSASLRLTWMSLHSLIKTNFCYICNWRYIASAPTAEKTVGTECLLNNCPATASYVIDRTIASSPWQRCREVFTATLCSNQRGAERCGSARLGSARREHRFPYCCLACIWSRSVNGQLPSNAVTIHVTILSSYLCLVLPKNYFSVRLSQENFACISLILMRVTCLAYIFIPGLIIPLFLLRRANYLLIMQLPASSRY